MNYIEFFQVTVPDWMRASNQKMQEVGFATNAYWNWASTSIAEVCKQHNDDQLVVAQFGIIWEWLEEKAKEIGVQS